MKKILLSVFSLAMAIGVQARTPGKVWTEEGALTAQVEAINYKTREITLKGPEGNSAVVEAGPDVKNFDQIKKGDTVVAKYTQSVVISVRKPMSEEVPSKTASIDGTGATMSGTMEVTASVESIDYKTRMVTLKGPAGNIRTLTAGPDVKHLDQVKAGDMVVARITKSVALSVQKPQ